MAGGLSANGTGAPPQAGVLEGVNPIAYAPGNPITLFIVQASGPPTISGPVDRCREPCVSFRSPIMQPTLVRVPADRGRRPCSGPAH